MKIRITDKDVQELVRRAKSNDREAMAELIDAFAPLIRQCTRKWLWQSNIKAEDLEQEGALIMMRAVELHNDTLGSFQPYAYQRIKAHMQRLAMGGKARGLSGGASLLSGRLWKLRKAYRSLPDDCPDKIAALAKDQSIEIETARGFVNLFLSGVGCLDKNLSDDPDSSITRRDMLVSDQMSPDIALREKRRASALRSAVDALPKNERDIIRWRYIGNECFGSQKEDACARPRKRYKGADSADGITLAEAAHRLGVTPQRTQQIERSAIARLRSILESDASFEMGDTEDEPSDQNHRGVE